MGATNHFSKASWKSVYTPQEALEKPSVAYTTSGNPCGFRKSIIHYCKRV
jgi:hypothetical protein